MREPAALDAALVRAFLAAERRRGLAARSQARAAAALRSFGRYLVLERVLGASPAAERACPGRYAARCRTRRVPTDMRMLLDAPPADTPLGRRDRAMLELLYGAGLRVSELVPLARRESRSRANCVRLVGKGSRERVVPLGRVARARLEEYLAPGAARTRGQARVRAPSSSSPARGTPLSRQIGVEAREAARADGVTRRARLTTQPPPRLRDAPPRRRRRSACGAGHARACRRVDDADLHSRGAAAPARGAPAVSSTRCAARPTAGMSASRAAVARGAAPRFRCVHGSCLLGTAMGNPDQIVEFLRQVALWAVPLLAAVIFHEVAHGVVALRLGDETAHAGRAPDVEPAAAHRSDGHGDSAGGPAASPARRSSGTRSRCPSTTPAARSAPRHGAGRARRARSPTSSSRSSVRVVFRAIVNYLEGRRRHRRRVGGSALPRWSWCRSR